MPKFSQNTNSTVSSSKFGTANTGPDSMVDSGNSGFYSLKDPLFASPNSSQSTITSPGASPHGSPHNSPRMTFDPSPSTSLYYPIIPLSRQSTGSTIGIKTTDTTMVDQGQYTNCGSITLAGLLIDAYKNFGQEILEKYSLSDNNITNLLRSLSDVKVRQLLKHYMGTDKMLELLGYNQKYNETYPQHKQLDRLPFEIEHFINSNEHFKSYSLSDPNYTYKCIFISTLFIFFLTSFNTLQNKEDRSIPIWDETSQNFTFRLDTEALTYYTQPKYDNFENLCFIFGWGNSVTWSDLSISLLQSYFDTIAKYKDDLNKKLTLQIKVNPSGNYDMYTFKLEDDFSITPTQTPITIPHIIASSKYILSEDQSIQYSTNVSNLDVHFCVSNVHSVLLVNYRNETFEAKNSWRQEYPVLDIDLKRDLEFISYSLQKTGDIMKHYLELFTIINEDEDYYDEKIQRQQLKKNKKSIKKLKFFLNRKKRLHELEIPEEILKNIYKIREKQLELEKMNDRLDNFIEKNPKKKKEIKELEKEYKIEKENINTLIEGVNTELKKINSLVIPKIKGGSKKKTIKRRKRRTIKRKKHTQRKTRKTRRN
jgi:hypothetical protein